MFQVTGSIPFQRSVVFSLSHESSLSKSIGKEPRRLLVDIGFRTVAKVSPCRSKKMEDAKGEFIT